MADGLPMDLFTFAESREAAQTEQVAETPDRALTVTDVTRRIDSLLRGDAVLSDLTVRGEISRPNKHASGHLYFTLKDEGAVLNCAMFRRYCASLRFQPSEGTRVVARGQIEVYAPRGQYQMIVRDLEPDGIGALYEAFVHLRTELEAEGLFAAERKRPIPPNPRRIGVITSATGAAFRDIVKVTVSRSRAVSLLLIPTLVQGAEAPEQLCAAIDRANRREDLDLLIVGRGGGSLEDLWSFNDEAVVRVIAASRLPVVSAVGHEIDVTLADLAADLRAPTPSGAAEMVVPDENARRRECGLLQRRLAAGILALLDGWDARLHRLTDRPVLQRPLEAVDRRRQQVDDLAQRLRTGIANDLHRRRLQLQALQGQVRALDPTAVLGRGYSILRYADGSIIGSVARARPGTAAEILVADGIVDCTLTGTRDRSRKVPLP